MPAQFLPGPLDKLLIVFSVSYSVPNLDKVISSYKNCNSYSNDKVW